MATFKMEKEDAGNGYSLYRILDDNGTCIDSRRSKRDYVAATLWGQNWEGNGEHLMEVNYHSTLDLAKKIKKRILSPYKGIGLAVLTNK